MIRALTLSACPQSLRGRDLDLKSPASLVNKLVFSALPTAAETWDTSPLRLAKELAPSCTFSAIDTGCSALRNDRQRLTAICFDRRKLLHPYPSETCLSLAPFFPKPRLVSDTSMTYSNRLCPFQSKALMATISHRAELLVHCQPPVIPLRFKPRSTLPQRR